MTKVVVCRLTLPTLGSVPAEVANDPELELLELELLELELLALGLLELPEPLIGEVLAPAEELVPTELDEAVELD